MCGIFGHYGQFNPSNLVNGLQKLEYRGYDSAGLAIIHDGKLNLSKSVGKVAMLEPKSKLLPTTNLSKVGIAHTRWATHGNPSEANAHPHSSHNGQVAIVHNGIIDNFKDLRAGLVKRGITFYSQTDTEVIAKLIQTYYQGDIKQAILQVVPLLNGSYSFAAICEQEPDRIVAIHNGCPLILGLMENEFVISSDPAAIVEHTRDVIYLDCGEIVDIADGNYQITDFQDLPLTKTQSRIEWDSEQASKSGYDHYLIKEIMEQGASMKATLRNRVNFEKKAISLNGLDSVQERLKTIDSIVLLGIGTSYYAAKLGELYFEELTGLPCKAEMTPEFRLKANTVNDRTWVIAISQSGETYDTLHAARMALNKGALVTGIVNVVGSSLAKVCEAGVFNQIGPEISVASSKAFSSQAALLLVHALHLNQVQGRTNPIDLIDSLSQLGDSIDTALLLEPQCKSIAQKYHNSTDIFFLGLKFSYPIALEGALKLKEISPSIHAEGLSAGELKHGFIAMIDKTRPRATIVINPTDSVHAKTTNAIEQVKARLGKVILILTDPKGFEDESDTLVVPLVNEHIQPLVCVVILQLIAYHCSVLNGFDVDRPENLAKCVSVE
jgi:glutamine---fructose-6-phosphate transaminase (isomerizing)